MFGMITVCCAADDFIPCANHPEPGRLLCSICIAEGRTPRPRVMGVDLSLTATGIAVASGTDVIKSKLAGVERLHAIASAVVGLAQAFDGDGMPIPTRVFVEGYAFARPNQAHQLGELGGVVRYVLWDNGVPWTDVPPATVKKFATGKGNAKKPDMLDASRRAGYEGSNDDNAVDAWWLRQFGLYALDHPDLEVDHYGYRDDAVAAISLALKAAA